jgi:hypothetical protein
MIVQLKCASLPMPIGMFAAHYWFTVLDSRSGRCDRWEVWQSKDAGGVSVGHLHCNLKEPDAGVGGGPAVLAAEWKNEEASRIKEILDKTGEQYPHRHHYLPWPGPNSNTFVVWVLRKAGIELQLPWKAIGKDFDAGKDHA